MEEVTKQLDAVQKRRAARQYGRAQGRLIFFNTDSEAVMLDGGPGSGNFGHAGIPGQRGGSSAGGGGGSESSSSGKGSSSEKSSEKGSDDSSPEAIAEKYPNLTESEAKIVSDLKQKYGSFEYNGKELIVSEEPLYQSGGWEGGYSWSNEGGEFDLITGEYLGGAEDGATAIDPSTAKNGWCDDYSVRWAIEEFSSNDEERNTCDWEHPTSVRKAGRWNLKEGRHA